MTNTTSHDERVHVLVSGGTITMSDEGAGAVPSDEVARSLASGLDAEVTSEVVSTTPSPSLSWADVVELATRIDSFARARGVGRFVIAQGTDTLEDVAFALDLMVAPPLRVVVTGAMYPSTHPDFDGPNNLLDSIAVARDDAYSAEGVVVCITGEIHRAAQVHKTASAGVPAFSSLGAPLGSTSGGRSPQVPPRDATARQTLPPLPRPVSRVPRVPIVRASLGDDGAALAGLPVDSRGVVIEGFGAGNIPEAMRDEVVLLAERMPVVLATRIRPGAVIEGAYAYPGSITDLTAVGVIPAGPLGADKSRILLSLLLASGAAGNEVAEKFRRHAHRAATAPIAAITPS